MNHPPLERLVEQALTRPPDQRAAYLIEISSGDEKLHRQLEALLAERESASGIGGDGSGADDARGRGEPALPPGSMIGGYRLVGQLGRGAMGEVYVAEDTRLGRNVALKLLPSRLTGQAERVTRFQREARAASALNHPCIVTIHDFGEHAGRHYIAAELVEGRTLRELIRAGGVELALAVEITAQVAQALAAAHAAGIVHRDIKPENVMLRPDGFVKLLDFGLAKLTAAEATADERAGDPGHPVSEPLETQLGSMLGTVSYMSPEQARGERVDSRSDLFSLGVVLYELVSGRRPFAGDSPREVLDAILSSDPAPLAILPSASMGMLQRVLGRLLAKPAHDRYQTAFELLADLNALRQDLAPQPFPRGGSRARPAKLRLLAVSGGLFLVALAAVWMVESDGRILPPGTGGPSNPLDRLRMRKVTNTGDALFGCISPDGERVAYVLSRPEGVSLWIEDLATERASRLVPPAAASYWSFGFAPDGQSVYYVREDRGHRVGGVLYRVPISGGAPRSLIVGIASMAVSPDGRLLFKRFEGPSRVSTLLIADSDGNDERVVVAGSATRELLTFAWAPDAKSIAYAFSGEGESGKYWELVEQPLAGGPPRTILTPRHAEIGGFTFLPDGSGLVVSAEDEFSLVKQLWRVSYPDGAMSRITRDLNHYGYPVVTADGRQIVTVQQSRPARIWVAPLDDPGRGRPLMAGTGDYGELAWTPDGRLIYVLASNGEWNLWTMDSDGGSPRQLTRNARVNLMPDVSPDGRYIVFLSSRTGDLRLWRMDPDGRNPVQLGDDEAWHPQVSPDGQSVVYEVQVGGRWRVRRVSIHGGAPVELTQRESSRPAISPDGRWLACEYFDEELQRTRLSVQPLAGGPTTGVFDLSPGYDTVRWSADGTALLSISDSRDEILRQPIAGGPPERLVEAAYEWIFAFALSRDGKRIAYTAGHLTSDVIQLSDSP